MAFGRYGTLDRHPFGNRNPGGAEKLLARSFRMASAEARTPEWYRECAASPKCLHNAVSPYRPCSALKATSGLSFASVSAMLRSTSSFVTTKPSVRGLRAGLAEHSDTSRSAERPPMRTATCLVMITNHQFGKVFGANRTKVFHVKRFGTIDDQGEMTRARRGEI